MARRGSFGRQPRAVPDLTSTIIALAREMVAAEDKNITDAWQKGGMYQGKRVTDAMILAHWQEKVKGLPKDDPVYDEAHNTVMQLEYSIAESRASTSYAQGKLSDAGMAAFYINWSKKVPKDSEFYRVLQRDGAQFLRASAAKGAAAAKKAAEAQYQASQKATSDRHERVGQYLVDTLTKMQAANGIDPTKPDVSDPATILGLLKSFNGAFTGAGTWSKRPYAVDNVLYHDPITGKAVTSADVLAKLQTLDPHFTGAVTLDYYSQALKDQLAGQAERLARAQATGHASDATAIEKWQAYTADNGRVANAWPIEQSYNNLRQQWLQAWGNPTSSPEVKLAAFNEYAAGLTKLANDKIRPPDDATKARLMAEAAGNTSIEPLATDFTGSGSPQTAAKDIAETQIDVQRFQLYHDAVAGGRAVWAYGKYDDSTGRFVPGAGAEIGATTLPEAQASSKDGSILTYIPQGGGLPAIPVFVPAKEVTARVVDVNGNPVASTNPNADVVALAYDTVVNGVPTRMYSYTGQDGKQVYTTDAPWNTRSVSTHSTPSGVELTVTLPAVPDATNTAGLAWFSTDTKGNLYVDPKQLVLSTNPARLSAGVDPNTDSFSPTLALLHDATDGSSILTALSKDPMFKAILGYDAQVASGVDINGQGGDQAKFQGLSQYIASWMTEPTRLNAAGRVNGGYDKLSTAPTVQSMPSVPSAPPAPSVPSPTETPAGPPIPGMAPWNRPLPSDALRSGAAFGPLAGLFKPGTSQLIGAPELRNGFDIRLGKPLTVPGVSTALVPGAPVPLSTSTSIIPPATPLALPPVPISTLGSSSPFASPSDLRTPRVGNRPVAV